MSDDDLLFSGEDLGRWKRRELPAGWLLNRHSLLLQRMRARAAEFQHYSPSSSVGDQKFSLPAAMDHAINIRPYRGDDLDTLIELFAGSVRQVASRDYDAAQIEAWAPVAVNREHWATRLGSRPTYVAEAGGDIVGFSDLESDGHIDMLFVHANHQGQGIARALLDHIHARANDQGIIRLFTEASITARPFFERNGFEVVEAQDVELRGQTFRNYRMAKSLRSSVSHLPTDSRFHTITE